MQHYVSLLLLMLTLAGCQFRADDCTAGGGGSSTRAACGRPAATALRTPSGNAPPTARVLAPTPMITPSVVLPTLTAILPTATMTPIPLPTLDPNAVIVEPGDSVQQAVDRAQPGSTIYLRAGTYAEEVIIRHSGPVTLASYPGEVAIIDGGPSPAIRSSGDVSNWTIENLTLKSSGRYTVRLGWWNEGQTDHWIVRNCKIYGTLFTIGSYHLFEGNDVDGTGYNVHEGDGGMADADISHHNVFRNNTIHDFNHYNARGIWTHGLTHDDVIENNTIENIMPPGSNGQCIDLDGASNVVWRHVVRHNRVNNCYYVGIQLENAFDSIVEGNVITGEAFAGMIVINYGSDIGCRTAEGYGDTDGDGSCVGNDTNTIIRNNLLYRLDGGWGWGYGGLVNWNAGGVHISNNTIYALWGSGNGGINFQGMPAMAWGTLTDNVISLGDGVPICAQNLASFQVDDRNLLWHAKRPTVYGMGASCEQGYTLAEYQAATGRGAGSIQADPQFVDPMKGDFRLQPTSPALPWGYSGWGE